MSTPDQILGDCPRCETPIPADRLLVEYEAADGSKCFAECPDCLNLVTPA